MKKLIIFDLDGTLAESKQPLEQHMGEWIGKLLGVCRVAVISGGAWPQFQTQLLANLPGGPSVVVGDRSGHVYGLNLATGNEAPLSMSTGLSP